MTTNEMEKELEFVNRRFDRDAGVFEAIYNDEEKGFTRWFNKNFRKPIYERFDIAMNTVGDARGKSIIDVGCGTGVYITNLGQKGAKSVLGVDFSEGMLRIAGERIKKLNLEKTCSLRRANFLELETPEKFDYSIAMGVFDYLPDPVTFLNKLKSVTTGKVIASFPSHSLIRGPLRKLRYILTSRGNVYYYSKADIEKLAKMVGFSHFELVPVKTGSGFVLVATP